MKRLLYGLIFTSLVSGIFNHSISAKNTGLKYVPGIINVTTKVSDGYYSMSALDYIARKSGVPIVVVTDHYLLKVEYGLPPFRSIIKVRKTRNSVFSYGIKRYLNLIKKVNQTNSSSLIVPGVKVTPFYYWTGSLFHRNLVFHDFQKEMLIVGLKNLADYRGIPVIGNPHFPYDQYHGDMGSKPYQYLIDYVNKKGGLIFWSAPEATSSGDVDHITFFTKPYPQALLQTRNYTGFACFYEGYRVVGYPGGVWDKILSEYCRGQRKKPVWTIGELDFHSPAENKAINEVQTVFLLKKISEDSVINALKNGKCYALWKSTWGKYELILNDFTVSTRNGKYGRMGDTVVTSLGPVFINFSISCSDGKARRINIKLIKFGKVIKNFIGFTPINVRFRDTSPPEGKETYYRLNVETQYPNKIMTNPIFVKFVKFYRK